MSDGAALLPCHLPQDIEAVDASPPKDGPTTLHGQERTLIIQALEKCGWNQSKAARALWITRYHVRHRMKKYNIRRPGGVAGGNGRDAADWPTVP